MSKTDGVILNSIGCQLDDDPMPVMYIGPTKKNTESISNDRVKKMLRSVPSLWESLAKGKKDKITEKFINGVRLGFGWAGSATELASHPAAKVFIDERDRMGNDVSGEGDVNTLAEARVATYDGCVITTSTPLTGHVESKRHETGLIHWVKSDDVTSPTWVLFQEGSAHEWAWPCPECMEYYIPRFNLLTWPEGSNAREAYRNASMACPNCGCLHKDDRKEWMNDRGVFVAPGQRPLAYDGGDVVEIINDDHTHCRVSFGSYLLPSNQPIELSFWVSGLCSPWRSFGHRARSFLNAVDSREAGKIQASINTGFGELYSLGGDAPEWERVAEHRREYLVGEVNPNIQLIVMGVDVQKDSLYYTVRGYGLDTESWLIEYGQIMGDTLRNEVWDNLEQFKRTTYNNIPIKRVFIDSGYRVDSVYSFCRKNNMWAFPSKGHDSQEKPVKSSRIDVTYNGVTYRGGLQLWHIDSDYFKTWVHDKVISEEAIGAWHLPKDTTEDYCRQIVAEAKTVKPSGKVVWIRLKKDNHYLDCEALSTACAFSLNVSMLRKEPKKEERKPQQFVKRRTESWFRK